MSNLLPPNIPRFQGSIRRLLVFTVLALLFFVWIILKNSRDTENSAFWGRQMNNVIRHYRDVNVLLSETQTATLNYRATREPEWDNQVLTLRRQLDSTLEDTRNFIVDNPRQQSWVQDLSRMISDQRTLADSLPLFSESPVILPSQGSLPSETSPSSQGSVLSQAPLSSSLLSGFNSRSQALNRSIKDTLARMTQAETDLLMDRIAKNKINRSKTFYITLISGIFAFALIILILIQLNKDIRRRKMAEEEARASEAKYRNLIENAGGVMYTIDISGYINFVSSKSTQLTGFSPQELQNKHFSALTNSAWLEKVTNHYIDQIKTRTEETVIEFPIVTRDGTTKWVEQSAVLLADNNSVTGFQCIVKDISEKKQLQWDLEKKDAQLRENQDRLQSIMDNAPLVIYLKDLEARYLMINNKFKELWGVDERVIGRSAFDVNEDKEATARRLEKDKTVILTKRPVQMEESIVTPEGVHHFSVMKFPLLKPDGEVVSVCTIATDITETIKYQQQLIEARKLAEDAKSKEELFLANMSHEIRTPMNGIMGMTDLLLDTPLTDRQKEFAGTIKHSANSLLVIINDILDLSKIKAGKLTLEKINFKLSETTSHLAAFFKHHLNKKNLKLELHTDENIPDVLTGDPFRLNQVLANLISNAIKFTETGYIRIDIHLENKTDQQVRLKFVVEDTGIGIPEDKMHLIFEDFSQAGTDITRKYGGTGLGLAICKQLLKMQDGEISVQSVVDKGTQFTFTIPYSYPDPRALHVSPEDHSIDYTTTLAGKRFLVAEDNEVNQRLIAYILEKIGASADIAGNGKDAVEYVRKGNVYDLIIMDLQMPEMDGYEATRYLRQEMKSSVPIIAMTATAMKGEKMKCLETGMNDYMSKPFEFRELYRRISMLIGHRSSVDLNRKVV